jgi:hypothetical protein
VVSFFNHKMKKSNLVVCVQFVGGFMCRIAATYRSPAGVHWGGQGAADHQNAILPQWG